MNHIKKWENFNPHLKVNLFALVMNDARIICYGGQMMYGPLDLDQPTHCRVRWPQFRYGNESVPTL